MAAVLALATFRPGWEDWSKALLISLYFFSGSSFCFLMNDLFDKEKDLANDKFRPISTGKLSVRNTVIALVIFGIGFLSFGYGLNRMMLVLAVAAILSFWVYSPANNKTGFFANAFVAFWAVAPIWEMNFIKLHHESWWWLSIGLFVMVIVREILLDWLDVTGDKRVGKPSLPIAVGEKYLKFILAFLMILGSVFIVSIPWHIEVSKITYPFFILSVILSWIPFIQLLKVVDRKTILFNIRFSHVSFGIFVIALFLR